jgi:hypothetical protein
VPDSPNSVLLLPHFYRTSQTDEYGKHPEHSGQGILHIVPDHVFIFSDFIAAHALFPQQRA